VAVIVAGWMVVTVDALPIAAAPETAITGAATKVAMSANMRYRCLRSNRCSGISFLPGLVTFTYVTPTFLTNLGHTCLLRSGCRICSWFCLIQVAIRWHASDDRRSKGRRSFGIQSKDPERLRKS
jgi:hypothetical protein